MALLEDVANRVAARTLRLIEETGDEDLEKKVADQIGASSPTLQEAFTTALRILKAEARATRYIDKIEGIEPQEKAAPAPEKPAPEPEVQAEKPEEPVAPIEEPMLEAVPEEPEAEAETPVTMPENPVLVSEKRAAKSEDPAPEPEVEQEPDMIEHLIALSDGEDDPFADDDEIIALPSPSAAS